MTGRANYALDPQVVLNNQTQLIDNSGGTPSDTIAVIADSATANAIASLTAKVNVLTLQLKAKGHMTLD